MLQFCLASKNLQEQYSKILYLLLLSYVQRTLNKALSNASVFILASFSRLKIYKKGVIVKAFFSAKKALFCLRPYINLRVFFVMSKSGVVIFKQPLINFLKKFVNPIKDQTSLTKVSVSQLQISASFFKLTFILFLKIINLRYLVLIIQNLLLS